MILIAAVGDSYQLGLNNTLPWRNSEDLKFFKSKTENGVLVMGRKTLESLPFKLPNRKIICISSNHSYTNPFADEIHSDFSKIPEDAIICGGASIYEYALQNFSPKVFLSRIPYQGPADTFFPQTLLSKYVTTDVVDYNTFKLEVYEVKV